MSLLKFINLFFISLALKGIETSGASNKSPLNNLSSTSPTQTITPESGVITPESGVMVTLHSNLVSQTQADSNVSNSETEPTLSTKTKVELPSPPTETNSNSVNLSSTKYSTPTFRDISTSATHDPENNQNQREFYNSTNSPYTHDTESDANDSFSDQPLQPEFTAIINQLYQDYDATATIPFVFEQWNDEMMETDVPCANPNEDAFLFKVLVGGYDGVYWADSTTEKLPTLVSRKNLDAYSVDYHYKKGYVFFSAFHNMIIRMNIESLFPAGNVTIVANDTGDVQLTVDWVRDQLYWMSAQNKTIERANLDGKHKRLIYQNDSSDFSYPRNLVIDPYAGYLFFVDTESVFRINLSNELLEEVQFSMSDPGIITCLALDRHKKRMYFSGTNSDTYIASSEYDGMDVEIHNITIMEPWNFIFSLDVYRDILIVAHYSEVDGDALFEAEVSPSDTSARNIFIPPKTKNGTAGIRIYHSNVQNPIDFRTCLEADNE